MVAAVVTRSTLRARATRAFLLAMTLRATAGLAHDAGVVDAPPVNPMGLVTAASGAAVPLLTHTLRHREDRPWERSLRMPVERGRCYELLGYATGSSPVFAQVLAGRARVGDSLAMTSAVGRVARARFCAAEPGDMYTLSLRAEGEAWWYLAVVPAEGSADAGVAAMSAAAPDRAPSRAPSEQFPVGDGDDYIARQIQAFARQRPGLTGLTRTARTALPTNGAYESTLSIASGRCVDLVAVGVPSVADLVVELEDPSGHRVAQDATHRNAENIRHCAPYAGTFRLRVRVFSGAGLVGVQALLEP